MNLEEAIQKGLIINEDKSLYVQLENFYKYLFETYLCSVEDLKAYNDEIKNNPYYIGRANPENIKLYSGLQEYLNLEFIYLLNNFYIEKLSIQDIELLKQGINNPPLHATPELLEMIKRTFKEVMKKNYFHDKYIEEEVQVCYGVAIPSNFASNDALVLKIYYGKNSQELEGKTFVDNLVKQKEFLNMVKTEMENSIKNKLGINVKVLIEKISSV